MVNHDVRVRSHVVHTYRGHQREVCGLKWADSGRRLASGGDDNLVYVWDLRTASTPTGSRNSPHPWIHRFDEHTSAVKALGWCPFQSNLLASGGGGNDRCIKLWNTETGTCVNSVDTGSQVCSLIWSKKEKELLSSHGYSQNRLTLWQYPSMGKIIDLTGHTSRVLCTALVWTNSPRSRPFFPTCCLLLVMTTRHRPRRARTGVLWHRWRLTRR